MQRYGRKITDYSMALAGFALLAAGWIVDPGHGLIFSAWSTIGIAYAAYATFRLLKERRFLLGSLSLFLFYGVAIVWLLNFTLGLPMSSWREGWEGSRAFVETLRNAIIYLTFFASLCHLALAALPPVKIAKPRPLNAALWLPVLALSITAGGILLAIAGTQARDDYLLSADVGTMFLVQATSLLVAALFAFSLFFMPRGPGRLQINVLLFLIALAVAANGFRFILVIFAFIAAFHILATRKMSSRTVAYGSVVAVAGYVLLLIFAYTRSEGMTLVQSFAFAFNPDLEEALIYAGGADQINFIAQDYYYLRPEMLWGQTYIDAFLRLAPNVVHTAFFETIRSQDYIVATADFLPDLFRENNWTMGSHLFVEALINFGRAGPFVMLTIFTGGLTMMELHSRRSHAFFVGYIVLASMGYALAWYGFSNALKQGAFGFLAAYVIVYTCRAYLGRGRQPLALRQGLGSSTMTR